MSEITDTRPPAARPHEVRRARTAFTAVVAVVLVALLLFAMVRLFIPTIPPEQTAPEDHFGRPCAACHLVIEGAEEVDVE